MHRGSEVFNFFLDDDCLWETLINALLVDRLSDAIKKSLLTVSERVLVWIKGPGVVALFLNTSRNVAVSLLIHSGYCASFFI